MELCATSLGYVVDVVVQRPGMLLLAPRPAWKEMIRKTEKRSESGGRTLGTKVG